MKTFDLIYVLDLHGNANKKEKAPDGSEDKNVFDIKQGVAIFFGIKKKGQKGNEAKIFRADSYGSRLSKFEFLNKNSVKSVEWNEIVTSAPSYEWVSRNEKLLTVYQKGFSVSALFSVLNVGFVTARDEMSIRYTRDSIEKVVTDFQTVEIDTLRIKYNLRKDSNDWHVDSAKDDVIKNYSEEKFIPISYRPFDTRWTYYTGNSNGFHCRPRREIMHHFLAGDNIGLITVNRSPLKTPASYYFLTKYPHSNGYIRSDSVSIDTVFPLYLYAEDGTRIPNLNNEIVDEIEKIVGKVTPEKVFDYIYATLYSPIYREKYKEFLKIDFPRVPYPKDTESFKKLVTLGTELRSLHFLESTKVDKFITIYPIAGSDKVEKLVYKNGKVIINADQYFGNVPESAWNFYIGGYQPAQKWLKDRKERTLTNEDIEHYQKIIVALTETERIMGEISKIELA